MKKKVLNPQIIYFKISIVQQQEKKTETSLRMTKKNFQSEELPHELILTARQRTIMKNLFAYNMLTYI